MSWNYRQLEDVRRYAAAIGAECRASPWVTARKDGDLTPLAFRVPQRELLARARWAGARLPPRPSGPGVAAVCRGQPLRLRHELRGDVMACNILPGSGGNVREQSFREVWEGSELAAEGALDPSARSAQCGSCERLAYCGRCHAQALTEDGDLLGPSAQARERAELIEQIGAPIDDRAVESGA